VDDKFYTGLVKCVGGTDVARLLAGNSLGEILNAYYTRDRFNFMNQRQCEQSFQSKAAELKQIHVCVLNLSEPTNSDLVAVRQSSILALADLVKIYEVDISDRLCGLQDPTPTPIPGYSDPLMEDARRAYANAQKHLQYAQSMLDKYRREHGK
jgi:hypothetical protein